MIMITVTILALVLVYKSFCNTVCIYMVMQIKLVVVVVVIPGALLFFRRLIAFRILFFVGGEQSISSLFTHLPN